MLGIYTSIHMRVIQCHDVIRNVYLIVKTEKSSHASYDGRHSFSTENPSKVSA